MSGSRQIRGKSCRNAAATFNFGTIAAVLIPVPVGLLWLGASMIVYALNRHHPHPKVGHYTQQAAYRFYGIMGFLVAVAVFFPGNSWRLYLISWVITAAILIPWSIVDLVRIYRDRWDDFEILGEEAPQE